VKMMQIVHKIREIRLNPRQFVVWEPKNPRESVV